MRKVVFTAAALAFCTAAVQAAPLTAEKHMSARSTAQRYWLSDGLNRLVFWKPAGAQQRDERRSN